MKRKTRSLFLPERWRWIPAGLLLVCLAGAGWALDWPQFQGPDRNSISKETGLLKSWPKAGLPTLWRVPLGDGYSGISVSQGKLYTVFSHGPDEFVLCLDAVTGKEIWRTRIDIRYKGGRGDGSRSTPTVDGNLLFTVTATGFLHALDAASGKILWKRNLPREFKGEVPGHGYSTSPIVEGDLVLVEVGGKPNRAVMAFRKKDGAEVWSAGEDQPGYSSPVAVNVHGVRQILFLTGTSLLSVSPKGELFWRYPWQTRYNINVASPILVPPDKVFISSAYDHGAALLQIKMREGKPAVEKIWESKVMKNHFHSSVRHGDYLYGFDNAVLVCIHALTGEQKWQHSGFGKGSLILADGHFIVLGERGQLALVEVDPSAYREKFQYQALEGLTWTAPTLANGKLYLRNQKELVCLDISGKKQPK